MDWEKAFISGLRHISGCFISSEAKLFDFLVEQSFFPYSIHEAFFSAKEIIVRPGVVRIRDGEVFWNNNNKDQLNKGDHFGFFWELYLKMFRVLLCITICWVASRLIYMYLFTGERYPFSDTKRVFNTWLWNCIRYYLFDWLTYISPPVCLLDASIQSICNIKGIKTTLFSLPLQVRVDCHSLFIHFLIADSP